MTYYRTCHNCAADKATCPTRAAIRNQCKGLGLLSVKHRCMYRVPMFTPGQRVSVTWSINDAEEYGEYGNHWMDHTWPATVIQEAGTKFVICVDDTASDGDWPIGDWMKNGRFAKVSSSKLKAIDEPERVLCKLCGSVEGDNYNGCHEGYSPDQRCMREIDKVTATATHPAKPQR